ncbi:MAG TPA: transposase [Nitrospiria bacterium]|nr:transposase [Nitrospiria bacterium]
MTNHDFNRPYRRSVRLSGYDYSRAGAYFVTICTEDRACLFGDAVTDGDMRLNDSGRMVIAEWGALPVRFSTVDLDAFVIMPNHVHGVIVMARADRATTRVAPTGDNATTPDLVGAGLVPARASARNAASDRTSRATANRATTNVAPTVGDIVGAFKSLTTVRYIRGVNTLGWPAFRGRLWQRNYYEHIIRNEDSLNRIRQYILENPARWTFDRENPVAVSPERDPPWLV